VNSQEKSAVGMSEIVRELTPKELAYLRSLVKERDRLEALLDGAAGIMVCGDDSLRIDIDRGVICKREPESPDGA
jgi:hypothetical protein